MPPGNRPDDRTVASAHLQSARRQDQEAISFKPKFEEVYVLAQHSISRNPPEVLIGMLHRQYGTDSTISPQSYSVVLAVWFKSAHNGPDSTRHHALPTAARETASRHATAAGGHLSPTARQSIQLRSMGCPCTGDARSVADRVGQSACWLHHPASSSSALRCSGSLEASADLTQRRASASASCRFMSRSFGHHDPVLTASSALRFTKLNHLPDLGGYSCREPDFNLRVNDVVSQSN
jgi:hypothetical protein